MLFQGNELAVTQGGRSAHKVYFWITYSSHADRVWKWPLEELHMVMNEADALGMSSIKYSHKWGWKCSRQQALEEAAKKRSQTFRRSTQMEHKMPLRDTSADETLSSKDTLYKAADGRQEHQQKDAVTYCQVLQNMLSKAVFLSSKHKSQSLTQLPGTVLPGQVGENSTAFQ